MSCSLWEPGRIGPMMVRNRTVRSATHEHLSEPDGQLTEVWAETQIRLARHEVGLVITGHMTVDRTQRADEGQPVMDERTDATLLKMAADGVHAYGGHILVQLSHSGPKAKERVNGCPAKRPQDFTLEELDDLVERFVFAAKKCKQAGMDGVQIHNAHGYLLSSFLNPKENLRTDEYGGSLENRFRIIGRILAGVRQACGADFALLVKADSNGCGDLHGLLELYQTAGVDAVEISGLDFANRAGERSPFYLSALLEAKEGIDLPLILVGGILSRQAAEEVLEKGIPFVSFCRALICQPDFVQRMKNGEQEESGCLVCNGCYRVYRKKHVLCVQHDEPIAQLKKVFTY